MMPAAHRSTCLHLAAQNHAPGDIAAALNAEHGTTYTRRSVLVELGQVPRGEVARRAVAGKRDAARGRRASVVLDQPFAQLLKAPPIVPGSYQNGVAARAARLRFEGLPDESAARFPVCEGGVTLTEIDALGCRWPLNGEGAAMRFCGERRVGGTSYCRMHNRLVYSKRRV